jgi:hypothetical protein
VSGRHLQRITAVLALAAALATGCGYRLGGGVGLQRLSVPPVENRTPEAWAGAHLSGALRLEVERLGLALASPGEAFSLWVRLVSIEAVPRALAVAAGVFAAREQEVRVRIEARLHDPAGVAQGDPLRLDERESYLSAPDLRGTQANLNMAARLVLERLAARATERLLRRF